MQRAKHPSLLAETTESRGLRVAGTRSASHRLVECLLFIVFVHLRFRCQRHFREKKRNRELTPKKQPGFGHGTPIANRECLKSGFPRNTQAMIGDSKLTSQFRQSNHSVESKLPRQGATLRRGGCLGSNRMLVSPAPQKP